MDEIIDLILENLFFIIIIIGVIINLFGKVSKSEKVEENAPIPNPPVFKKNEQEELNDSLQAEKAEFESNSLEEERQKQMERLTRQFHSRTFDDVTDKTMSSMSDMPMLQTKRLKKEPEIGNFQDRLTQKGLAESIIMAEVLGPPRALKPYKSVTERRINQKYSK